MKLLEDISNLCYITWDINIFAKKLISFSFDTVHLFVYLHSGGVAAEYCLENGASQHLSGSRDVLNYTVLKWKMFVFNRYREKESVYTQYTQSVPRG